MSSLKLYTRINYGLHKGNLFFYIHVEFYGLHYALFHDVGRRLVCNLSFYTSVIVSITHNVCATRIVLYLCNGAYWLYKLFYKLGHLLKNFISVPLFFVILMNGFECVVLVYF